MWVSSGSTVVSSASLRMSSNRIWVSWTALVTAEQTISSPSSANPAWPRMSTAVMPPPSARVNTALVMAYALIVPIVTFV